ncbi:MAG: DUF4832 domain-containing protein [Eubacterium sp.]|nr:DUF4832 domain-containing protein [Eubacterium sp.]
MKTKGFKLTGILLACCMVLMLLGKNIGNVSGQEMVAHSIAAGESKEGNPLKGFVPFEEKTSAFPHSMEWFYIPVSAVQTGMNTFDWTALENRLNTIAARGHQAVMRFYYDYPGEPSGVPQFLIDQGLEMRYYDEPERLGGSGYCPDYSNTTFRQSMVNLINAFGSKYDGDGRIGYVTLGLLGFWGEWHNWPYDDGTVPGKNWSIPTAAFQEVLDAYDSAFQKTQLCAREPKSGIDFNQYDVGFHDDSFGYATLSVKNGGQDWSFMQKMYNFGQGERWKRNCIGGEVYPPSQNQIFSGATSNGEFQDWNLCMEEAHATWMLCEQMKYYQGTTKTNARNAAKQLGYDFRVTTAYYPDRCEGTLPIRIDMKNIGSAPFYYDHEVWPVAIGVKQSGTLVKQWQTDWDLCDIPADATVRSFSKTIENPGLNAGNYTLCMKVLNPLEHGNVLGFANQGQESDGWLNLGTVTISESMEETTKEEITTKEETTSEKETESSMPDGTTFTARVEGNSVLCQLDTSVNYSYLQLYLDQDGSTQTGFVNGSDGLDTKGGFDYLIEDGALYSYGGSGTNWSWNTAGTVSVSKEKNYATISIPKTALTNLTDRAKIQLRLVDSSWNGIYVSPLISVEPEQIEENLLEVEGYQVNPKYHGIRTIYSVGETLQGQEVKEFGLIYGIGLEGYEPQDMKVNSKNPMIYVVPCDLSKGKFSQNSDLSNRYAMTLRFAAGNAKEFQTTYFVRAYAILKDNRIVYTDIHNYRIYDIAEEAYKNENTGLQDKEYLLEMILKKGKK